MTKAFKLRLIKVMGDKELTTREIVYLLKETDTYSNSFTSYQIGQVLRGKEFEKVRYSREAKGHIWRVKQ